jgi:phage shock protein E
MQKEEVNMKKRNIPAITFSVLLALLIGVALTGCGTTKDPADGEMPSVVNITAEEGKTMMDEDPTIILVDVRTEEEYKEEHIPGALLLPVDDMENLASEVISDKEAVYIIYCRSGNRSATAAQQLINLGYQNIYDMGGIIDWPYDTETGI